VQWTPLRLAREAAARPASRVPQGPLMLAERQLARLAGSAGIKVPWAASVLATLAVLEATASQGFFPPVEQDTDLASRFAQAVAANISGAAALFARR
jgi:hypothetical protein